MKTSVIEVRDMLSVLSVLGVEELIGKVPGVESVTMNFATGSATVRYDETRLEIADIKSAARQSGFVTADAPGPGTAASAGTIQPGKTASGAAPSPPPKPSPDAAAVPPTLDKPKPPADATAAAPATAAHATDEPHHKATPAKS